MKKKRTEQNNVTDHELVFGLSSPVTPVGPKRGLESPFRKSMSGRSFYSRDGVFFVSGISKD